MAKKHINENKDASYQRSRGRSGAPKDNSSGRERNVRHEKSEEHSRVNKGNKS